VEAPVKRALLVALSCLGGALWVGCRDYGALEGVDDLSAEASDLGPDLAASDDLALEDGPGDGAMPTDLAPGCKLVPHDRDAGPPSDPNVSWVSTETFYAVPPPDGGAPVGIPSYVTVGDADGDGYLDAVTAVSDATTNGSQFAFFKGQSSGGHADFVARWTANSTTNKVRYVALADFLPDEVATARPQAELITSQDAAEPNVAITHSTVSVWRLLESGTYALMPALDLKTLTGPGAAAYSRTRNITRADLDGDGKIDLLLGINHWDRVSATPYPMGSLLVLWGGTVTSLETKAPPYFDWTGVQASYVDIPVANPEEIVVADLDNDCVPEIVTSGTSLDGTGTTVQLVRVGISATRSLDPTTKLTLTDGFAGWMTALDLDRAGYRSILLSRTSDYVVLDPAGGNVAAPSFDRRTFGINAPGSTCSSGDVACMGPPTGLVSADFDGDGADDVFMTGYFQWQNPTTYAGAWYRNDSKGSLVRRPSTGTVLRDQSTGKFTVADAVVGDIDGDGRREILFVDTGFRRGLFMNRIAP
jgi:hypothetical protein